MAGPLEKRIGPKALLGVPAGKWVEASGLFAPLLRQGSAQSVTYEYMLLPCTLAFLALKQKSSLVGGLTEACMGDLT